MSHWKKLLVQNLEEGNADHCLVELIGNPLGVLAPVSSSSLNLRIVQKRVARSWWVDWTLG